MKHLSTAAGFRDSQLLFMGSGAEVHQLKKGTLRLRYFEPQLRYIEIRNVPRKMMICWRSIGQRKNQHNWLAASEANSGVERIAGHDQRIPRLRIPHGMCHRAAREPQGEAKPWGFSPTGAMKQISRQWNAKCSVFLNEVSHQA